MQNRDSGAGMIKVEKREQLKRKEIRLFQEPTDSVIISIIEGKKGDVWTDENMIQAFAFDGIYGYLDGNVTKEFVADALQIAIDTKTMDSITIIPQNESAERILLQFVDENKQISYKKKKRYLMSEPKNGFDISELREYVDTLPENMKIESFNEYYFNIMKGDTDLEYLVESYRDYNEFKKQGIGYLVTENQNILAGALSYSTYSKGIEVQLMTVPTHRGRGIAKAIVARLLLYCAEKELRAIWDAANLTSVSIANKMGYVIKRKYNAYTIISEL